MAFDLKGKAVKKLLLPTVDYTGSPIQIVQAQSGDIASRFLSIVLFDDRGNIDVSAYEVAFLNTTLPNGELQFSEGEIKNGVVYFELTGSMLKETGKMACDVTLGIKRTEQEDYDVTLTSQTFYVMVYKSQFNKEALEGTEDYNILVSLIAEVDEFKDSVNSSFESLKNEMEAKVDNGNFDGKSVYIKYSNNSDGSGFTTIWSGSQKYIGIATAFTEPANKTDYTWIKFIGDLDTGDDLSITEITYELQNGFDQTYKANNISKVNIQVPSTIKHGFYAGINFKSSSVPPLVKIKSNSVYPLKLLKYGITLSGEYEPSANMASMLSFYCDGINMLCYINEV